MSKSKLRAHESAYRFMNLSDRRRRYNGFSRGPFPLTHLDDILIYQGWPCLISQNSRHNNEPEA